MDAPEPTIDLKETLMSAVKILRKLEQTSRVGVNVISTLPVALANLPAINYAIDTIEQELRRQLRELADLSAEVNAAELAEMNRPRRAAGAEGLEQPCEPKPEVHNV